MNKVSIKPLGENTKAIFFEKENGHEMAFLFQQGNESVNVCEKIVVEDIPIYCPLTVISLAWLEGLIDHLLNREKKADLSVCVMKTPLKKDFEFSEEDFKSLKNYLETQKGGSDGK